MPIEAERFYAKSPVPGGETLPEHTRQVMRRLGQLRQRLPALADEIELPQLWQIVSWAVWFHDFGKAAPGFQRQLRTKTPWGYRHEVLSLPFLAWVFEPDSEEFKFAAAAVVSHHRDHNFIERTYITDQREVSDSVIDKKWRSEFSNEILDVLWRWTLDEANSARSSVVGDLPATCLAFSQQELAGFFQNAPELIQAALRIFDSLFNEQKPSFRNRNGNFRLRRQLLVLRGLILESDRLASAGAATLSMPNLERIEFLARTRTDWFQHQRECGETEGNVLLRAPTGSGKTEAALFWAKRNLETASGAPSLFYVLPFQASINAMYQRIRDRYEFGEAQTALLHSRATAALYRDLVEQGVDFITASHQAKQSRSLSKLATNPVMVATPYQLLRAAFRLPGYEAQWLMLRHGRFIFDEIHGYEPMRLGLILGLLRALGEQCVGRILCMTATMPTWLNERCAEALAPCTKVEAAPALFEDFKRHRMTVISGPVTAEASIQEILIKARLGMKVLVVANMVKTAQEIFSALRESEDQLEVLLLHSRFTARDRFLKEDYVLKCTNSQDGKGLIVVATQVVEVSLDVDFDILFTEPAPLEALFQRFGRVNRRRLHDHRPVIVFDEPVDWRRPYGQEALLHRTVEHLKKHDGEVLDEAKVSEWLDEIYARSREMIEENVEKGIEAFESICGSKRLIAFQSDEDAVEQFEALFDGTEVLPSSLFHEFLELHAEGRFLEAGMLTVPISHGHFSMLSAKQLITRCSEHRIMLADQLYSADRGLEFSETPVGGPGIVI